MSFLDETSLQRKRTVKEPLENSTSALLKKVSSKFRQIIEGS